MKFLLKLHPCKKEFSSKSENHEKASPDKERGKVKPLNNQPN
jgi:hypothetical protein